ncbi:MAG: acetate--CoA ligase family protein [Haloferacaceae archaeon]
MGDLTGLFTPERVAVVGATDREGSVGRALMENLLDSFAGDVLPVNPNRGMVLGRECYPAIDEVPGSVDLAVVAVPAAAVADVVRQAGEAGVTGVVVITAGFGEAGPEGERRQEELAAVAAEYDLDLVGPNCVGIISTPNGLNATFAPENARSGSISFMSQSGAFVTAVLDWAADADVGFKDLVSLGNEAVLDAVDFAREWSDDPDTKVILAYLEGIADGRAFIDDVREVTRETPVVVIKSGRTEAGARAAASHTGSLAGSATAYRAGLDQAGAIYVEDVEDFFDFGQVLADQPLPETDRVAVVTNSGGPGVLTADAIGDTRLSLAEFGDRTRAALADLLPEEGEVNDPLDVIGDADVDRYRGALDAVLADEGVGGVVAIACPTRTLDFAELADAILDLHETHEKPIVTCLMGGKLTHEAVHRVQRRAIPNYFAPKRAVASLDVLARYREIASREYEPPTTFDVDAERVRGILADAADRGRTALGVEAMDVLDAYGISTPDGDLAESADAAEAVAREIGGPVAMKLASPDLLHKSDAGLVRTNVALDDVASTYDDLDARAREHRPDATVLGVLIQEQVDVGEGQETIVGVNRDPQFGPLVMFGFGGIFVQVFRDTTFRVAPVSEREARRMTEEIRAAPLLRGARGRPELAVGDVVETIQRVSQLAVDFPAIAELDVNPLIALPGGVSAVDFRLTIDPERL